MKKLVSRTAMVAAACMLTALVIAQPPMGRFGPPSGGDPAQMIRHMADRLDLSEDQQADMTKLLNAEREKMQSEHDKMGELRKQLMSQTDEFVDDKVRGITDEMGVLSGKLAYSRAFMFSELSKILTEDQRTELTSLLKARGEHSGGRRGKHKER